MSPSLQPLLTMADKVEETVGVYRSDVNGGNEAHDSRLYIE